MKDKGEMIELGLMMTPFVERFISDIYLQNWPYKSILDLGIFIVCFTLLFTIEYYYMLIAQPFPYIRATIRPSNKIRHFFVIKFHPMKITPTTSSQRLELNWPFNHEYYGEVKEVVIIHKGIWQDRVIFEPGRALRGDWVIDHANTTQVTLYEPREGDADMYRDQPIPIYVLKEAPGDYYNEFPTTTIDPTPALEKGAEST